jgi:poly-gamma-glutamate synthesis protein (capsule biosynthesis protein)
MAAQRPTHLPPGAPSPRRRTGLLVGLVVFAVAALGVAVVFDASTDDGTATETADEVTTSTPADDDGSTTTEADGPGAGLAPGQGTGEAITIAFAGDSNFEGNLRNRLENDPEGALGPFAEVLRAADLAVINLETAIAVGGAPVDKDFTFRVPSTAVAALRAAGVDVASMANNHGMDFGNEGLVESLRAKNAQADGMIIGIGEDEDDAFAPYRATVKGQRIAVIAATQVLDASLIESWTATATKGGLASAKRVARLVEEVERARQDSDTVVVFLHWGVEKDTCPSLDQQQLAETLAAAGADIIVGSHAHRLQGGGRLGSAVVHYGLGNFLFKENSVEGARTGVFEVTVAGRRIDSYEWIPGQIANSVPRPLIGGAASDAIAYWNGLRSCAGLLR